MAIIPFQDHFNPFLLHNKKESRISATLCLFGGATGNRTRDTRIFSPLLYQLSYDTIFISTNAVSRLGLQR